MKKLHYSWGMFDQDIKIIYDKLKNLNLKCIYAIPKGGLVLGVTLANKLSIPLFRRLKDAQQTYKNDEIIIVDDISDTGDTLLNTPNSRDCLTVTLFTKTHTTFQPNISCRECNRDIWVVFPWE